MPRIPEDYESENKICRGCKFWKTKTEAIFEQIEGLLAEKENDQPEISDVETPGEFQWSEESFSSEAAPVQIRSKISTGEIVDAAFRAFDLKKHEASGATFVFPTSLTDYEWICLNGYSIGYNKADREKQEREKPKK